jgi:dihydroorotate dehydrogenase
VYKFLRYFLFKINPESAHHLTFKLNKILFRTPILNFFPKLFFSTPNDPVKLFGINFPNRVGLAAGLDKNAEMFTEFSKMGFGFIEIGTLTPVGQPGNPKPRLFRLTADNAIINRMGFNNEGVEDAVRRLKKNKGVIIGGNIGKNKLTPNDKATEDYKICFEALFSHVHYFVVNVSSPNTPGLRELQEKKPLLEILNTLQNHELQVTHPKPIFLKIAPDLTNEQLNDIIEIVQESKITGVIATNTTIDRGGLTTKEAFVEKIGNGGLSGEPLKQRSTEVIKYLSDKSEKSFIIIGVGGIHTAEDAVEKIKAGASLVQLYTGFIYEGASLIGKITTQLKREGL